MQIDEMNLPVRLTVSEFNLLLAAGVVFPRLAPFAFFVERKTGEWIDKHDPKDDPTYGSRTTDSPPKKVKVRPQYVRRTPNRWGDYGHASECNMKNPAVGECAEGAGMVPGAEVCLCPECPDITEDQLERVVVEYTGLLIGTLRRPGFVGKPIIVYETITEIEGAHENEIESEEADEEDDNSLR